VAWSFGQANVTGNDSAKNLVSKVTAYIGGHLAAEGCALVVHGEEDTFKTKLRIEMGAHPVQRIQKFRQAL